MKAFSAKAKATSGNSAEAADDLFEGEYEGDDEIEIQKKVRIDVKPSEIYDDHEVEKGTQILHWMKVGMLCFAWIIYAIAIVTHKESVEEEKLVGIFPKETKLVELSTEAALKDRAILHFYGPFKYGQDALLEISEEEAYVEMRLELVRENKIHQITQTWFLKLEGRDNLEYIKTSQKSITFEINQEHVQPRGNGSVQLSLRTNVEGICTLKVFFDLKPIDLSYGIPLGAVVLIFLYVMIISEIVDRTFAAVVASTLAIGILSALDARPSTQTVMSWVDVETLLLLFGMMILVSILSESGIFDYSAVMAYEVSKGNLFGLIYVLCIFTGIFSAFLDNVTMMLLVAPVTIRLCEVCNLNPVPVIMSMVIYSNIGAALTPVGDPPNVLIMTNKYITANGVNFGNFCLHMLPPVVLGMISTFIHLKIRYPKISAYMNKESPEVEALRHEIQVWEKAAQMIAPYTTDEMIVQNTLLKKAATLKEKLAAEEAKGGNALQNFEDTLVHMKATYYIRNKKLLIKASIAFIFVLTLFFMNTVPGLQHLSLGWCALVGALLLLILADDEDIESVLSRVEWSTLLFFACLFALMEALTELGLIDVLGDFCVRVIGNAGHEYRLLVAIMLILWVSGIASAFLANIPVTTMMVKIVIKLADNDKLNLPLTPLVWALALGACFGGNGTLIGASANVVSSGIAQQHGYRISFLRFIFFGFPIMINTLCVATFYLFIAHCVLEWHDTK